MVNVVVCAAQVIAPFPCLGSALRHLGEITKAQGGKGRVSPFFLTSYNIYYTTFFALCQIFKAAFLRPI